MSWRARHPPMSAALAGRVSVCGSTFQAPIQPTEADATMDANMDANMVNVACPSEISRYNRSTFKKQRKVDTRYNARLPLPLPLRTVSAPQPKKLQVCPRIDGCQSSTAVPLDEPATVTGVKIDNKGLEVLGTPRLLGLELLVWSIVHVARPSTPAVTFSNAAASP